MTQQFLDKQNINLTYIYIRDGIQLYQPTSLGTKWNSEECSYYISWLYDYDRSSMSAWVWHNHISIVRRPGWPEWVIWWPVPHPHRNQCVNSAKTTNKHLALINTARVNTVNCPWGYPRLVFPDSTPLLLLSPQAGVLRGWDTSAGCLLTDTAAGEGGARRWWWNSHHFTPNLPPIQVRRFMIW